MAASPSVCQNSISKERSISSSFPRRSITSLGRAPAVGRGFSFALLLTSLFIGVHSLDRGKSGIERVDQLVDMILCRVEHQAGANDVAVEPALADQHAATFCLFKNFHHRL